MDNTITLLALTSSGGLSMAALFYHWKRGLLLGAVAGVLLGAVIGLALGPFATWGMVPLLAIWLVTLWIPAQSAPRTALSTALVPVHNPGVPVPVEANAAPEKRDCAFCGLEVEVTADTDEEEKVLCDLCRAAITQSQPYLRALTPEAMMEKLRVGFKPRRYLPHSLAQTRAFERFVQRLEIQHQSTPALPEITGPPSQNAPSPPFREAAAPQSAEKIERSTPEAESRPEPKVRPEPEVRPATMVICPHCDALNDTRNDSCRVCHQPLWRDRRDV
jgi:ribosomal protein L40E